MRLTDGQLEALRNLSQKKAGGLVGWIGIAEARGLTDLGFATRHASGWQITPAGAAWLEQERPAGAAPAAVVPFPGREPEAT
jgi:hypothetical protein